MRKLFSLILGPAVAVVGTLTFAQEAHAGLESCGNIDVAADAQCQVVTSGGCDAQCTPLKMDLACSAKLEASCTGQCSATLDASCNTSCTADCTGRCTANPGSLDCQGDCEATCDADCSGKCSASSNQAQCQASCKATCGGHCSAKCTGTPPSADCNAKCSASCSGSCTAKANLDCQINCQSKGYAQCEADLEGGCKVKCTDPKGALFCNGQYVDVGDNLQNCIDALNAYLNVKVTANASSSCDGGTCEAQANASASCAAAPGDQPMSPLFLAGGLGLVAFAGARRRSRKSDKN